MIRISVYCSLWSKWNTVVSIKYGAVNEWRVWFQEVTLAAFRSTLALRKKTQPSHMISQDAALANHILYMQAHIPGGLLCNGIFPFVYLCHSDLSPRWTHSLGCWAWISWALWQQHYICLPTQAAAYTCKLSMLTSSPHWLSSKSSCIPPSVYTDTEQYLLPSTASTLMEDWWEKILNPGFAVMHIKCEWNVSCYAADIDSYITLNWSLSVPCMWGRQLRVQLKCFLWSLLGCQYASNNLV